MKIEGGVFTGLILLGTACSIDQAAALQNCQSIPRNSMTLEQFTQCYAGDGANATNTYDYIVVGAGAAGSVVSARLAQAGKKVLVLEAGPDTSPTSGVPDLSGMLLPILRTNYTLQHTFTAPGVTGVPSCSQLLASNTNLDFISQSDNSTKYYAYPRGAGAGGSASITTGYVDGIGSMKLYDKIAAYLQDPFWQGDNILRLAKKMEKMPAGYNPSYYGNAGWLHSSKSSIEIQDPIYAKILNGANSIGIPTRTDFRAPGQQSGIGLVGNSVYSAIAYPGAGDGRRSYSYKDLLLPTLLNPQYDIRVKFNTLVGQVILKENENDQSDISQNAIGVEVFEKPYLQKVQSAGGVVIDGTNGRCLLVAPDKTKPSPTRYFALKEIIISAGAIQTPQLLMLSGIGDPKQLKANNIVPKVNLPGVGKNIMDHTEVFVQFEMDPRKWYPSYVATSLASVGAVNSIPDPQIKSTVVAANKPGLFVDGPNALILEWPSGVGDSTDPAEPDLHIMTWSGASPTDFDIPDLGRRPLVDEPSAMYQHPRRFFEPLYNNPLDPVGEPTRYSMMLSPFNISAPRVFFGWLLENLRPSNVTGTVTLQSNDPAIPPKLDMGLEKDDVGVRRLATGVMLIRQIMSDPAIKDLALDPNNFESRPGKYAATLTDVENYIKTWSAFGHHPSGGAAMGPKGDKMRVLDSKLRVLHVGGLRVADTSVYPAPYIHGYNTTRAAYIMGEAASELILEDCTDD